ncbi:MAG: hypothetical protein ACHQLA_05330 [Ignavibacteriales bacterium]
MKNNKSNILLYGLLIGGLVGAGAAIYFTSKYFTEKRKINRMKKNKFYEGIEDIFDASGAETPDENIISEQEILDQLYSNPE